MRTEFLADAFQWSDGIGGGAIIVAEQQRGVVGVRADDGDGCQAFGQGEGVLRVFEER